VAVAKPEQPEPGTPTPKPEPSVVKSPPRNRSRTCWRQRRAALLPLHQAEPPVFFLCSTAPSSLPCPGAQGEPQPPRPCCGPGLRAKAEPSLVSSLSSVTFLDRCPAPRRCANPQSLESWPSSQAGRFAGAAAIVAERAPLPCDRAIPLYRRVSPSSGLLSAPTRCARHRRAKALPFFGQESCEHKPLSCACCRCCAIATAVPPTFCPHTPPPGQGAVLPGRTCARTHTRTRGHSPVYVPNQRRRVIPRRPPFFVPLPSAHHQFRVAATAAPSVFGTHTNAGNRGAEPLLHLPVTVLDLPSWPRRRRLHKCERIHPKGRTPLLSLSNPCAHSRQGETLPS
jgi:hypothetical protein